MTIKGIIVGVLIWQALTTIVFIATDADEKKTAYFGGGIPFWIIAGIFIMIKRILKWICFHSSRSILVDKEGNWFYCSPKLVDEIREEKGLNFPNWTEEIKIRYPKSMWGKYPQKYGYTWMVGNFRYAPRKIWSQFQEVFYEGK